MRIDFNQSTKTLSIGNYAVGDVVMGVNSRDVILIADGPNASRYYISLSDGKLLSTTPTGLYIKVNAKVVVE